MMATKLPSCAKNCYVARMNGRCLVCDADPQVRSAVEELLLKRVPLRKIQRQSGFDKSTLSRHGSHMPNPALERNRQSRFHRRTQRVLTRLNGQLFIQHDPAAPDDAGKPIAQSEVRGDDAVVVVRLTQGKVGNPAALSIVPPGLSVEQLEAFFRNRNSRPVETPQADDPVLVPVAMCAIEQRGSEVQQSQPERATEPENSQQ